MVSIDIKFKTKDILMELKKDKTYNDIILKLINKESETEKKIKEIYNKFDVPYQQKISNREIKNLLVNTFPEYFKENDK